MPGFRNPGRRELKSAEESRGKWVHHHDSVGVFMLQRAIALLPEDAEPERVAGLRRALGELLPFKPYKRKHPRRHEVVQAFKQMRRESRRQAAQ